MTLSFTHVNWTFNPLTYTLSDNEVYYHERLGW